MTTRTGDLKRSSNVTPDKGHKKNLVSSLPLKKDQIHIIETSEPRGSKPFYTLSDNSFTERSHDENNIEDYKLMNKLFEDSE